MTYQLYHFGLCCRNLHKSLGFYQGLGCELLRVIDNDEYRVAFLGTGSEIILELNENPLMIEEKYFTKRKGSINSISFKVDNIYEAYKDMEKKNMRIVWKPKEKKGIYQFGFLDEEGMLIKIFNYIQEEAYFSKDSLNKEKIMLKELCLLTSQYEKTVEVYETALGLEKKNLDREVGSDCRMSLLGDSDESPCILIKEIPDIDRINEKLNAPCFTERERQYILKYGNGYEHLCFEVLKKEKQSEMEDWTMDPDGNHIRLLIKSGG